MQRSLIDAGLKIGVIEVVFQLILYFLGLDYMLSIWVGVFNFILLLSLCIYFSTSYRKQQHGVLVFKHAFIYVLGLFMLSGLVMLVYSIILYGIIDPKLPQVLQEKLVEKSVSWMERFNLPQEKIDETIAELGKSSDTFSVSGLISGYFKSIFFWGIFSLIIALIVKRAPSPFNNTGTEQA